MHRLCFVLSALLVVHCGDSNPRDPEPLEVIVRDAARILDTAARASLTSYTPASGELRFSDATYADVWQTGHVLVSEPTTAAPMGLLRKVVSLRVEAGETVVETEPAALYEAIEQGGFVADVELEPVDLRPTFGTEPWSVGVGHVLADADGNPATTDDQVRMDGSASLKLGYYMEWTVFNASKLIDDWNPFDSFDLEFRAWAGIHEDVNATVTMAPVGGFSGNAEVVNQYFDSYTIWVGPVPVVITPHLLVTVDGYGGAYGRQTSFGGHQWFAAEVGADCDPGCSAIANFSKGVEGHEPTLALTDNGYSFEATGGFTARIEMLVYGAAGPYGALSPYVRLRAAVPGRPAWTLTGGAVGSGGLTISPLGIDWGGQLFHKSWDLAESQNHPPVVRFTMPSNSANVQVRVPVHLRTAPNDLEEGTDCCSVTFTSDVDGALGTAAAYGGITTTFDSPGPRTITAVARDSDGATAQDTLTINVVNTPPDAVIMQPWNETTVFRGIPFIIRGRATDANEVGGQLPCANVVWGGGGGGGDVIPTDLCAADSEGMSAATFNTLGNRSLTLTATDPQGGQDTATVALTIATPPADVRPDVTVLQPDMSGLVLGSSSPEVEMRFHVFDPDDDTVTYSWQAGWPCGLNEACANSQTFASGSVVGASSLSGTPGATQSDIWSVFSTLPSPGCGAQYPAVLELRVNGATVGRYLKFEVRVSRPPC